MKIRPVKQKDVYNLWLWHSDDLTRQMSVSQKKITFGAHLDWIVRQKGDIYIAEVAGVAVGVCRVNRIDELSWTIAPGERGQGYGTEMIGKIVQEVKKTIAFIKAENIASIKIAQRAGLEKEELLVFRQKQKI